MHHLGSSGTSNFHSPRTQWYIIAKRATPLTNTQVKQCNASDKEYALNDGNGLQLKVKPSGSKTWVLKYVKSFSKIRTNLGLGIYPEVSLAEAEKKEKLLENCLRKVLTPKK